MASKYLSSLSKDDYSDLTKKLKRINIMASLADEKISQYRLLFK